MLLNYNCELHFPGATKHRLYVLCALSEIIMSCGIALTKALVTKGLSLPLCTCIEPQCAEPSLLQFWCSGLSCTLELCSKCSYIIIWCVLKCHYLISVIDKHKLKPKIFPTAPIPIEVLKSRSCSQRCNLKLVLAFLYQIIHRRPSSSGSLPPGCRRWVSRRWERNGGRCRCLRVSQAERSAQREQTETTSTHVHQPTAENCLF